MIATQQTLQPAAPMKPAVPAKRGGDIRSLLDGEQFKNQVARALPKHLTPDRFIRVAITTMMRTPKLAQCDQASFFNALMTLSQLGIEPDGRRAHLIPFENRKRGVTECQLIIDYKGLVELAMRSGLVANIHADVVCENDGFSYNLGEIEAHKIDFRQPRGEAYAAYAVVTFKDGTRKAEVMSRDEIEAIRSRSRAGNAGPWVTDWNEMAKKTVFRRLAKWLPLSPEYRDALEADDDRLDRIELANVMPTASAPKPLKRADAVVVAPDDPADEIPFDHPVEPALDLEPTDAEGPQVSPDDEREVLIAKLAHLAKTHDLTFARSCKRNGVKIAEWRAADMETLVKILADFDEVVP